MEELPDDEVDMMKVMGFGNFDSTKVRKLISLSGAKYFLTVFQF